MRSESVCVSLENGRATATMAIRMPMLSLTIAGEAILQKKTPASAGVEWLEAVPGVEHGDKGLAGPTP